MISNGVFVSNRCARSVISTGVNIEENYTRYNRDVDPTAAQQLLDLNFRFYTDHGNDFSATRERLQPGVRRLLDTLEREEAILDIGCGNGELARVLSRRGQRGSYVGLDFSLPLLKEAQRESFSFPVKFLQVHLTSLEAKTEDLPASAFDVVFAFAVLHHIPGHALRTDLARQVWEWLKPGGKFMLSNWQFLSSRRLKGRIQPWSSIGLTEREVDRDDYLIDWKRGGQGLRYVHHFSQAELASLAQTAGFNILETFYSDGENRVSGLYQVWKKA